MAQVLAALRRLVLFSLPSASAEPTPQDYSRVPLFRGPNPNNYQYYFGGLLHYIHSYYKVLYRALNNYQYYCGVSYSLMGPKTLF